MICSIVILKQFLGFENPNYNTPVWGPKSLRCKIGPERSGLKKKEIRSGETEERERESLSLSL
jgi:hypothetical protein